MTTSYWIACTKCGKELLHGLHKPTGEIQYCVTSRALISDCRRVGCKTIMHESTAPLEIEDQIRLGLIDEAEGWELLRQRHKQERGVTT